MNFARVSFNVKFLFCFGNYFVFIKISTEDAFWAKYILYMLLNRPVLLGRHVRF